VTNIPPNEPEDILDGAFGKQTIMKSNAQLQRFQEPDEPVPPASATPSVASSSQSAPPSDAILGALTHITERLQSIDTHWSEQFQTMDIKMTEGFQSMGNRFQVLEAEVEQIQIKVRNTLCHLMPKDQRDRVP
jgi:hypothetical protein